MSKLILVNNIDKQTCYINPEFIVAIVYEENIGMVADGKGLNKFTGYRISMSNKLNIYISREEKDKLFLNHLYK